MDAKQFIKLSWNKKIEITLNDGRCYVLENESFYSKASNALILCCYRFGKSIIVPYSEIKILEIF